MKKYLVLIVLISFAFTSCASRVVRTRTAEKVVIVKTLPKNHRVVYVNGKRYYKWGGKRYRKSNGGYVVVTN